MAIQEDSRQPPTPMFAGKKVRYQDHILPNPVCRSTVPLSLSLTMKEDSTFIVLHQDAGRLQ